MLRSYRARYVDHAPELPETRAILRRLGLFIGASGLVEVRRRPRFVDRLPRQLVDHNSAWTDGVHDFVMTEPYHPVTPKNLDQGLVFIRLPLDLGIYGGGWSDDQDADPGTRSLLFTLKKNESALEKISMRLIIAAWGAPRWNQVGDDE